MNRDNVKTPAILFLAAAAVLPAHAVTNIGVSVGINAPGQYGRIDIDNYPQPALVNAQPIVYAPSTIAAYQRPVYLYVPQSQQTHWGRYCGGYRACGQPVYFVQQNWVRNQYHQEHDDTRNQHRQGNRGQDHRGNQHAKDRHHGHQGD